MNRPSPTRVMAPLDADRRTYFDLLKLRRHYSIWQDGRELDKVSNLTDAAMLWDKGRSTTSVFVVDMVSVNGCRTPAAVNRLSAAYLYEVRRQLRMRGLDPVHLIRGMGTDHAFSTDAIDALIKAGR
jgi:hypothetical protein